MSKNLKSNWDFGELFSEKATRRLVTVSQLTRQIRELLELQIGRLWVTGEITNLRLQSSGHTYFTIKDEQAQIGCVFFRRDAEARKHLLKEGQKINVHGELTVYEPRGQYQLRVLDLELVGIGALQQAYELLKQRLQVQGLFAPERKRPLPCFPARVGLITSPTGAALQDILHVVSRRNKSLEFILVPCRVQGAGAAEEMARAIGLLNRWNRNAEAKDKMQLIVLARGGGSLEDLWAFNEEVLARSVFNSELPVMSAVGHEIDFTICDFVADFRAATPSAAGEILTEAAVRACEFISETAERLQSQMRRRVFHLRENLRKAEQSLSRIHPSRWMARSFQRLDDLNTNMSSVAGDRVRILAGELDRLQKRFFRFRSQRMFERKLELCRQGSQRLKESLRIRLQFARERLQATSESLRLLSPEHVLARGYSITVESATGKVIRSASEVKVGQQVKIRLARGELLGEIKSSTVPKPSPSF